MVFDRRDILAMLRHENETLKAQNVKQRVQVTRHLQAFRALNQMDETMLRMQKGFDLSKLIKDLLALVLHACDAENGSMILVDDETDELVFAEVIGDTREQLIDHRIAIDTGIVGHVLKNRKTMLVTDVENSTKWSAEVDRVIGFNTNALMCAPLFNSEKVFGAIEVVNNLTSDQFDENDLAILRVAARFVSQALQQAEDITEMEGKVS